MPAKRPKQRCTNPGCNGLADKGRCDPCRIRRDGLRDAPYKTADWQKRRLNYLVNHPTCVTCGRLAEVVDHYPMSRRQLLDHRVPDPDAEHYLRGLCRKCDSRQTAQRQPNSWTRRA